MWVCYRVKKNHWRKQKVSINIIIGLYSQNLTIIFLVDILKLITIILLLLLLDNNVDIDNNVDDMTLNTWKKLAKNKFFNLFWESSFSHFNHTLSISLFFLSFSRNCFSHRLLLFIQNFVQKFFWFIIFGRPDIMNNKKKKDFIIYSVCMYVRIRFFFIRNNHAQMHFGGVCILRIMILARDMRPRPDQKRSDNHNLVQLAIWQQRKKEKWIFFIITGLHYRRTKYIRFDLFVSFGLVLFWFEFRQAIFIFIF